MSRSEWSEWSESGECKSKSEIERMQVRARVSVSHESERNEKNDWNGMAWHGVAWNGLEWNGGVV